MQITRDEPGQVLKIAGTLGISLAGELRNALRAFIGEAQQPVVDLTEVDGCDATALQLLCSARKTAEGSGKPFELTGVSAAILDASAALGLRLTECPATAANPAMRGDADAVRPN